MSANSRLVFDEKTWFEQQDAVQEALNQLSGNCDGCGWCLDCLHTERSTGVRRVSLKK
jgi:hypothetical protein